MSKQYEEEDTLTALSDVRVLDLSCGIAAPIVGMYLGDFGADVIKVERPEGDWARTRAGFAVWNRNKRGVVVDKAREQDTRWLAESIRGADVVLLGDADDLESAWGPGAATAAAENGGLITVRMPPYLDGYTPWPGRGESDGLLAAAGGQALRQASYDGGPVELVSAQMLYAHGVWAAACTVAALVERTVSGQGQVVTVTGMNGLAQATATSLCTNPMEPDPDMALGSGGRHPMYRRHECADGLWLACGALGKKFETLLLKALELDAILDDPRIQGDVQRMVLPENSEWCSAMVSDAFKTRKREELLELMDSLGIPCGPVLDRDEWLDHPQLQAIGMRVEIEDPARGNVVMPGIPINLTGTPGSVRLPAPMLGQHTGIVPWPPREIAPAEIPRLVPGPLTGFRVLNVGTFVATPYAGFLLSELGADVIKVEPLTGDPFRDSAYMVNRGMRSLAINLKTEDGQQTLHQLVSGAHAVMDGMRPGVMKKLNLDYERLKTVNPQIVTLSLSAFGASGPLSQEPGVDMVIQAMSGMMSSQGGEDEPVGNTIAINDVVTAALSALTVVLGIYHQQRAGQGQRTWDSLAATSAYLQMEELVRFEGRPAPRIGHRDFRGSDTLHSYHKVKDGWIYMDAESGTKSVHVTDIIKSLGHMGGDEAVQLLHAAGVRAVRARKVTEVLRDPRMLAEEVFHIRHAGDGSIFMTTGRHAGFSRTQRRGPLSVAGAGQHTCEVLAEGGLDKGRIDQLLTEGHVLSGEPIPQKLSIAYR